MKLNPLLLIFFTLLCYNAISQDMNPGFQLLESQQYNEAQSYFGEVLNTHPSNKTAQICYYRALGLSGNHSEALKGFLNMEDNFSNDYEVGLNVAEALMWNQQFLSANHKYLELSEKDPQNFVAQLGLANSLSSLSQHKKALSYINNCLKLKKNDPTALNSKKYILIGMAYMHAKKRNHKESLRWLDSIELIAPNQPNALVIRELIKSQKTNESEATYSQSEDIAGNLAQNVNFQQTINFHPKHRLQFQFGQRKTSNNSATAEASQREIGLSDNYFIKENITLNAGLGLNNLSSETQSQSNWIGSLSATWQANPYNYFSGSYQSSLLNYNTTLLNSMLRVNKYEVQHHVFVKKIGWYNALTQENITDGNSKLQWFSSLYYQILKKPILKMGANYSLSAYDERKPLLYFSPELYQAVEAFVHLENIGLDQSKFQYKLALAHGLQKFEDNAAQTISRLDLSLGYKLTPKLMITANYLYSNSAETTTVGSYQFNKMGLSARLIL